ncbi:hypothetical protein [Gilvimarinus sp. DA14]|uniref:hypothetical protein n=1 Tax=Gilvimarinus sp. DA14 TaxID=2956798 RepID=UPI0020B8B032|nr:hypothetical protein [Gilvimarinus sp. DA14]UTF61717.1 hypothetical protein NHM04_07980 [Gilvimarinus sp. DA14]
MRICMLMLFALFMVACSSAPKYQYTLEPTPLKAESTQYAIESVEVNLILGHGARDGDTRFNTEAKITEVFTQALSEELQARGALADGATADADLNIVVDFVREYNTGGKALNTPKVSHKVIASRGEQELAVFGLESYTLDYGIYDQMKIAGFQRGSEEELADVKRLAQLMADDIVQMGR